MKYLHREDLRAWSTFDESRDVDFNSIAWIRGDGNVLIDPLPMSDGDVRQLEELGGAAVVVVTNSDHIRDSRNLADRFGAQICGPAGERSTFAIDCDRWLGDGDEVVAGLSSIEMRGSKTPGELAVVLDGHTLITGDLVRGQHAGRLNLLPEPKLQDRAAAWDSVDRLAKLPNVEAVLVGDGWPVFSGGAAALRRLLAER